MMVTIKNVVDTLKKVKDQDLYFMEGRVFISYLFDVINRITLERNSYIQSNSNSENKEKTMNQEKSIIEDKKHVPPRTWEEFCEKYPIKDEEGTIGDLSGVFDFSGIKERRRNPMIDKNLCTSKEEAEAFLALMQLRQLRKAWIGDWELNGHDFYYIGWDLEDRDPIVCRCNDAVNHPLNFPTTEMAEDFLECFEDLCRDAYLLL